LHKKEQYSAQENVAFGKKCAGNIIRREEIKKCGQTKWYKGNRANWGPSN